METKTIIFKAEVSDVLFYYAGQRNDRSIRTRLQLDGELNLDILIQAFNKSIDLVPVLKSKWVVGRFYYHWELIQDFDIRDYMTVTYDFDEAENFLIEKIECEKGPQIKVLIYRNNGKDTIQITITHLCLDGIAFKHFYMLLSQYYTGLKRDENFVFNDLTDHDRNLWLIFKNFSLKQRLKFAVAPANLFDVNNAKYINIDDKSVERKKIFLKNKIEGNVLQKLISKSKKSGVTVNDVFMAALTKVVFDISKIEPSSHEISTTFNLRNHIKEKKKIDFTNKVSAVSIIIRKIEGESFEELLYRVGEQMKNNKKKYSSLFKQEFLRLIPFALSIPLLKKLLAKFCAGTDTFGISNIGIVSNDDFNFANLNIEDFFLNGALRNKVLPTLFFCSVNNHINVTCAMRGSEKEIEQIRKIIEMLISNIEKYVE